MLIISRKESFQDSKQLLQLFNASSLSTLNSTSFFITRNKFKVSVADLFSFISNLMFFPFAQIFIAYDSDKLKKCL